ncbi:MAG: GNAT family N-acetyltransferase [Akkermansiaceae bacterium]|nr:GNAT family N-acetyltransferase [Akkermansiaceae bacterium]
MDAGIEVDAVEGREVEALLGEVARLRIEVFREFPYLYAGHAAAEEHYLRSFAAAAGAVLVVARKQGEVVGVSTGLPLSEADPAFQAPFAKAGEEVGKWFYFGESVLRQDCRGCGVGHRFFDFREAHARAMGFGRTTFCAVERAADDPRRPETYRPLDDFWGKRGYRKRPELVAELGWEQVDSSGSEVTNRLSFWCRELQM